MSIVHNVFCDVCGIERGCTYYDEQFAPPPTWGSVVDAEFTAFAHICPACIPIALPKMTDVKEGEIG